MNFGDRMKEIRLKRDMTLLEVAEKLGKTEATIQRYESGNIKNLKSDTIEELAEILRTSPAYLMGWIDDEPESTNEYPYYPVFVAAGLPSSVEAVTAANVEKIEIPDLLMGKHAGSSDIYITKVNGDSMNKIFPNSSLIAVKHVNIHDLKDDDIVVFSDGVDYSVKRYFNDIEKKRIIFSPESTNRSFTDQSFSYDETNNLLIHGKVVMYIVSTD